MTCTRSARPRGLYLLACCLFSNANPWILASRVQIGYAADWVLNEPLYWFAPSHGLRFESWGEFLFNAWHVTTVTSLLWKSGKAIPQHNHPFRNFDTQICCQKTTFVLPNSWRCSAGSQACACTVIDTHANPQPAGSTCWVAECCVSTHSAALRLTSCRLSRSAWSATRVFHCHGAVAPPLSLPEALHLVLRRDK